MKTAIQKMINEYQLKIAGCEILTCDLECRKREIREFHRQTSPYVDELISIDKDITKLYTKKQAYTQAKRDFESLLDNI